ncbi:type 1 glutamine amidotransferase domain-containing protein [Massilia sp. BJB1822]|uniref:type 1 glutamine amidotransferase domain-containing protein n=1 Tax=Massilia sp. BJB1822 TaxID=2744470 RepID=UPI0015948391|nr:type 1 glutamine amidotransferase domain-containing protein [Massilia sp. BJB1822]NVE01434.1 type 1 glutamine amidotransferase domain-containing protein [Massilia sp. BJB1822]
MTKKILVVLTATEKYPNLQRATGIWLGEAVHFVDVVQQAGYEVDYLTPQGGYTPIDPHSLALAEPIDWEWYGRRDFMNRLGATLKPADVKAADYAAIYFVGGHGVMWDFPDNQDFQRLSREIYEAGGYVTSVCHGVVGLLNIKLSDGSLLIEGKQVTGFTNEEERQAELDKFVPFLTEDELVRRGAHFQKAQQPWQPFAVTDQRLITGQNPASGAAVARLLVQELAAR